MAVARALRRSEGEGTMGLFGLAGGRCELVDEHGDSSQLAFDEDGGVWIAYMGRHGLHLARQVRRGAWTSLCLDEVWGLYGSPPGLAVQNGQAHVVYRSSKCLIDGREWGALCYARLEGSTVTRQIVDKGQPGCCGTYPSLATGPLGGMAVSYRYDGAGDIDLNREVIRIARREDGNWQTTTASGSAPGGCGSSLAFDPAGRMHLVFSQRTSRGACTTGPICYGVEDLSGFKITKVDQREAGTPSLAVDAKGVPHMSYVLRNPDRDRASQLVYATLADGKWTLTNIGPAEGHHGIRAAPLAVDRQDNPVIAYIEGTTVKLANFAKGSWQTSAVWKWTTRRGHLLEDSGHPTHLSLALHPSGDCYISFTRQYHLDRSSEIHLLRR